jgi:acid phosphatase family membrane protein YuiD
MSERKYPLIDFSTLKKGDRLEVDYLEKLFGVNKYHSSYTSKLRGLQGDIEKYRPDLYVKSVKGAIVVMVDAEAVDYNAARTDTLMTSTINTISKQSRINSNELPEDKKRYFENRLQATAGVAVTIATSREKLRVLDIVKNNPPKELKDS